MGVHEIMEKTLKIDISYDLNTLIDIAHKERREIIIKQDQMLNNAWRSSEILNRYEREIDNLDHIIMWLQEKREADIDRCKDYIDLTERAGVK